MRLRHLLLESLPLADTEPEAKPTTSVRAVRWGCAVHANDAPKVVMLFTTIPALTLIERIVERRLRSSAAHGRSLEHTGSPAGTP
jgi:hypothetical protein